MPPPKKKPTPRGHIIRLAPDPPSLQDVLDEIDTLKDMLSTIHYSIEEIKRKIDDLPGEIERS
jgi:hypothetical protein